MQIIKYDSIAFQKLGLICEELLPVNPLIATCGGRSILKVLSPIQNHLSAYKDSKFLCGTYIMIDERLVPLSNEESNFKLVDEFFLNNLTITSPNVKVIPFETSDPNNSLASYSSILNKNNGKIDLTFLGVGEDGHIAGLFPDLKWCEDASFFIFDNSPKPPPKRMTASRQVIENSKTIVLTFLGEGKREAWMRFKNGEESINSCPCLMCKNAENLIVITDLE